MKIPYREKCPLAQPASGWRGKSKRDWIEPFEKENDSMIRFFLEVSGKLNKTK